MLSDLRHAFRALYKTPGFTLIAIMTLALGIGLNTAMFSLINTILLRPVAFPEPEQLVRLYRATPEQDRGGFSVADYLDLARSGNDFGQFAAYDNATVSISGPGQPAELRDSRRVTSSYLEVLRIQPALGRAFDATEEIHGNHRVVMLSHAFWLNRFSGSADVIGQTVRIAGEPHEIIGVLPASANDTRIMREVALLCPLAFTDAQRAARNQAALNVIGRRNASVSEQQGEAFIHNFGARIAAAYPEDNAGISWRSENLRVSTGNSRGRVIMAMLLGLSSFVLLIACSNLANFFLARTISRAHELAVRTSLGASRPRLIRPFVFESLIVASAGGAGALMVSVWSTNWLSAQSVATGGSVLEFPLDWRVLGFACTVVLFTALFFGVAPALFATRVNVNQALKTGARGTTAGRGHQRLRAILVVGQFTLAMVLLAGAGFFVRGTSNLLKDHFGWDTENVVIGGVELPKATYPDGSAVIALHQRAMERLAQLPGVIAVTASYASPVSGLPGPRGYLVQGRELPVKGQEPSASFNGVYPGYFDVIGTRLVRGREFVDTDTSTSPKVVIINEAMARALFPTEDPIGQRIARADITPHQWAEIVGIAADVRSPGVYHKPVAFQVYHPFPQEPWQFVLFSVRTVGIPAESVLAPFRAAVASVDADLPVQDLRTVQASLDRVSFDLQMLEKMLGTFALLGLSLAGLGIYGVIARTVAQRTGEIGIRMALGAQVSDVVTLVLGSGLRLALLGAALGLFGAFGLSQLFTSIMPAMKTDGSLVLAAATGLLVVIALVACYLPARTASKVDPLVALRAE